MNMHKNVRLTPNARVLLIERLARGEHPAEGVEAGDNGKKTSR